MSNLYQRSRKNDEITSIRIELPDPVKIEKAPVRYEVYHLKDDMKLEDYQKFDVNEELAKLFIDAPDVDWMHVPMRQLFEEHKITKEEYDSAVKIQATGVSVGLHRDKLDHPFAKSTIEYLFFATPIGWGLIIFIILDILFTINGWN